MKIAIGGIMLGLPQGTHHAYLQFSRLRRHRRGPINGIYRLPMYAFKVGEPSLQKQLIWEY
jgi:hypothetical protein